MKNNLTGGKPPKEMTILETHENNLKEFDEKFYSLTKQTCLWHRNFDLRLFLTSSTKAILESLKGELEKMKKVEGVHLQSDEYIDIDTYYNAAISDISAIINKSLEEI